jgi:hypothetical protein
MGWLTGWRWRKSHVINGSTAGSVTDYQIRIVVKYGSGTDSGDTVYLNGRCKTDFSDIRFTDSDGTTLLSYWRESYTASDTAIFWVKVPSIPQNGTATIYIYYGNPSATYTGSGSDTFIFFDDFNILDTTRWDIITFNNGSVSVSSSQLVLTVNNSSGGSGAGLISKSTFTGTYLAIEALMKRNTGQKIGEPGLFISFTNKAYRDTTNYGHYYSYSSDSLGIGAGASIFEYTSKRYRLFVNYYDIINFGSTSSPAWDGVWVRVSCYTDNSGLRTTGVFTYSNQTVTLTTAQASGEVSPLYLQVYYADYQQSNQQSYVDWIAVRKWISPEPTHGSWGSPETLINLSFSLNISSIFEAVKVIVIQFFISLNLTPQLEIFKTIITELSTSLSLTPQLQKSLQTKRTLDVSLTLSPQLQSILIKTLKLGTTVRVASRLSVRSSLIRRFQKSLTLSPTFEIRSVAPLCGLEDFTLPIIIRGQTIRYLAVDIAAQSIQKLNVNIAGSSITLDVNVKNATLNVNVTNATLNVNIASAPTLNVNIASATTLTVNVQTVQGNVNIVGQGGTLDRLQLNEGVLKAYNMKTRVYGTGAGNSATILTVPSGRTYYIVSAWISGGVYSDAPPGLWFISLYGYNSATGENIQFAIAMGHAGQSFNVTIPFATPIRLPSGSTVTIFTEEQTAGYAGVMFIDVPSAYEAYLLKSILETAEKIVDLTKMEEPNPDEIPAITSSPENSKNIKVRKNRGK